MKKRSLTKLFTAVLVSLLLCFQMLPTPSSAATVKLSKTKKTLTAGDTYRLKLKNAEGTVKWSSSNKDVAKVSKKGLVTAVGAGTCKIKAKYQSKTYICKVTVKEAVFAPIAYGDKPFPKFSLADDNGNTLDNSVFSNYYVTIVNFWEPWCGPCVRELPDLQAIYEDYKDKGVNIIGIYGSTYNAPQTIADAGLTYTQINDNTLYYELGDGYVPFTAYVDGFGNIISSGSGGKSYDGFKYNIEKYLP